MNDELKVGDLARLIGFENLVIILRVGRIYYDVFDIELGKFYYNQLKPQYGTLVGYYR